MSWISRIFGGKAPERVSQARAQIGLSIEGPNSPRSFLEERYRTCRDFDTAAKIRNNPIVRDMVKFAAGSGNPVDLADLARSPIHDVRLAAAKNRSAGSDTLRELAVSAQRELEDRSFPWQTELNRKILTTIAAHENTPEDILGNLTDNRSLPEVRGSGAFNPRTPWRAVADYLKDTERDEAGFDVGLAVQYFHDHYPLEDTLGSLGQVERIEYLLSLAEALDKRSAGDRENIGNNMPSVLADALMHARELKKALAV